jgi:glutathione peroxidase
MANIYEIPVQRITGEPTTLGDHRGKVLLIVNVASQCGLTPQYDALEGISTRFRNAGLVVCGFPANDFGAQEPGSNEEIQAFCRTNYSVDFPMYAKITVTGLDTHPLYQSLISAQPKAIGDSRPGFRDNLNNFLATKHNGATTNPEPGILWNFEKFLVDRKGNVIARFSPEITPDDPAIVAAVESALL